MSNVSAFPNDGQWANGCPEGGLTIREWYAGMALQGLLAGQSTQIAAAATAAGLKMDILAAQAAFQFADAMLEARKK